MKTKIQMSLLALLTSSSLLSANAITETQVVHSNDQYDYYTATIHGNTSGMKFFQLFIDTDSNPNTGYTHNGIGVKGADHMIEGSNSRTYTLQCSNNGCVNAQDLAPYEYRIKSDKVSIDLPRWRYGMGGSFKYRAIFLDSGWNEQGSYPDGQRMENYSDVEISSWQSNYAVGSDVWIELTNKPNNAQDWVGIYPTDLDNNWSNIVDWRWANDTSDTEEDPGNWYKFTNLEVGNYEARFFLNNSFVAEDSVEFSVSEQPNDDKYGEVGPHNVKRYDDNRFVVYYPEIIDNTPVVLFMPGGGNSKANDHEGLMRFIASHGNFVIGAESAADYSPWLAIDIFEDALGIAMDNHKIDTSKLAVIGHSLGGGLTFPVMKHFQGQGYGATSNFVLSLDGWFAFGMNQSDLQGLNTTASFIQFGGYKGTGTDPRINLSILNLLGSSSEKAFLTLATNDHSYSTGDLDTLVREKQNLLKPIHALMDYEFNGNSADSVMFDDYSEIVNNVIAELLDKNDTYYIADCEGYKYDARPTLLGNDISYCDY